MHIYKKKLVLNFRGDKYSITWVTHNRSLILTRRSYIEVQTFLIKEWKSLDCKERSSE